MSSNRDRLLVRELWTKSIETQLRLATFASRSRQLALAVVTLALVASGIALSGRAASTITIAGVHVIVHPGFVVLALAALVFAGFAVIDRQHDHMLRGATKFTEELEEKIVKPAVGGELACGLAQAFAREKPDERPVKLFRTWSVAAPAALGVIVLIASNLGPRPTHAVDTAAMTPAPIEETAMSAVAPEAQPALAPAPVPSAAIVPAPAFGKPVARTGKRDATGATAATDVAAATTAASAAAGAPPPAAAAAPAKAAEPAASKPAEAEAAKSAAPAPAPSKPAEEPAAKAAEPAPAPAQPAPPAAP